MKRSETERGDIEKVKWAIQLSRRNLTTLREGDWLNLKDELLTFVTDPSNIGSAKGLIDMLTLENAKHVQLKLKEAFECLASGKKSFGIFFPKGPNAEVSFGLIAVDPFRPFVETLHTLDFYLSIALALRARILRSKICPAQIRHCYECHALFLLERKPQAAKNYYCSTRCARNWASKAYRERLSDQKKQTERDKAHSRYVRKQRNKFPNAIVARRARSQKKTL